MDLPSIKVMEPENTYPVCESWGLRQFTAYTLPLSGISSQAKILLLWREGMLCKPNFLSIEGEIYHDKSILLSLDGRGLR
jgi:hypothetical protein